VFLFCIDFPHFSITFCTGTGTAFFFVGVLTLMHSGCVYVVSMHTLALGVAMKACVSKDCVLKSLLRPWFRGAKGPGNPAQPSKQVHTCPVQVYGII
jgi:hypothetical protein